MRVRLMAVLFITSATGLMLFLFVQSPFARGQGVAPDLKGPQADAQQAAKDIDAANKDAEANLPNKTVQSAEDKLDNAARKNADTPANDPNKAANQKAEDDARANADEANKAFGGKGDYRKALEKRREARMRLKKALEELGKVLQARRRLRNDNTDVESAIKEGNKAKGESEKKPEKPERTTTGMVVPQGKPTLTNAANGLYVTTFTNSQGKIKVNLTDDVAAGDTISGTVETEPAGNNDAERAQNQAELNGYVIELEGQKTKVGDKKLSCNIPIVLTAGGQTIIIQHNGQPVATTELPISVTPPPTPNQLTLPTGGQQGRPIECRGNFAPTDQVKIGGTILPPIAGSPRKLVVNNTSDVVGPTNIECSQHGVVSQCPFRNIAIKLSAPKLNLQRGETTTLHVVVMGLAGITKDEPLDLADNTPSVIKMSGGEVQHIIIHPAEVQRDGNYSTDRTLTGIQAGGFGVTGTVRWSDVCTHPAK